MKKASPAAQAFTRVLAEVREGSKSAYLAAWARWTAFERRPPIEWTVASVAGVYGGLCKSFQPATIRLTCSVAKRVWKQSQMLGVIPDEAPYPFRHLRIRMGGVRANVPEWNVLQKSEVARLEAALEHHPMELAIFLALVLQGWRASELCALRWEDLKVGDSGFSFASFIGKGSKLARVIVHPKVLEAARKWKGKNETGPFVGRDTRGTPLTRQFVTRVITKWAKKVLGHKVTPHGLRATFISAAIEQFGIEKASQLARHTDINLTKRYSRWALKETDLITF